MPVPNTESKNTRNPKPRNASVTATGTSNHAMDGIRTTPTLIGTTPTAKPGHETLPLDQNWDGWVFRKRRCFNYFKNKKQTYTNIYKPCQCQFWRASNTSRVCVRWNCQFGTEAEDKNLKHRQQSRRNDLRSFDAKKTRSTSASMRMAIHCIVGVTRLLGCQVAARISVKCGKKRAINTAMVLACKGHVSVRLLPALPPRANNMLINHATHFNQNPLELFPCNCIKYSNNMLCYQMCEIIKWKWTGLCEQNSWAKTHCSHPQHSIHQWVSYHGVLVFQYAEHTVPPKHGHTMAQKGTNGIKWTQFLHCSCSDWRPFQSQWFSFLIFPIQYLVTKSLSQDNLKRPVCNEGTTRLVRWPSDLKQQPPRDNILRTCKGLVRLMENAGSAVTSVTQPSCPTATSADLSCSSFKLSFKINSRITSICGVVFGLRWHALTYSLNLVDILRVQKVSCKLHWSK